MNLRRYIGIPYKSHACGFDGVDCYQLLRLFNREELGVELPDYKELYRDAHKQDDAAQAFDVGKRGWIKTGNPKLGDGLLFRDRGAVSHCGVYVDDECFLHIREGGLSCIEPLHGMHWGKRLTEMMTWSN